MFNRSLKFLTLAFFVSTASLTQAALIEYTFYGSGYPGGDSASGTFLYETGTNSFSEILITSTGGSQPARDYSYNHYSSNYFLVLLDPSDGPGYDNDPVFHIILQDGEVFGELNYNNVYSDIASCDKDHCPARDNLAVANRLSLTGEVVSQVPVPAAAWLFGSALLGLAGIKRK